MESVGKILKEVREEKKMSLSAVSKSLHISILFLELIENDDYSKMPGEAYTIGYIRSYSNLLNLDAGEIVKLYKDQVLTFKKVKPIKIQKPFQTFDFFVSYKLISFFSIVSLSLVFYFAFIYEKYNYPNFAITPDISENLQYEIEEIELEKALINLIEEKKESLKIKSENLSLDENNILNDNRYLLNKNNINTAIAALPTAMKEQSLDNLVTIKALDNTWIQLRNSNNEIIYSSLMILNEEYTYSINDNYKITTGNAGNLIISIDGNVKGKLGKKGEIIETLIITSDFFN